MKHIIVSIYDKKTEAYMRPFTAMTDGQAIRMFEDEALRPDSELSKHPEDYTLFRLASFNDANGEISGEASPHPLRNAHEVRPSKQED